MKSLSKRVVLIIASVLLFVSCFAFNPTEVSAAQKDPLVLQINGEAVDIDWEDNASVDALRKMASRNPITIRMSKYGGFEQFGEIGKTLPSDDHQITTSAGDVVLYDQDQMVIFYGSNTWEYTKLGKINLSEAQLKELLGGENVTVVIRVKGAPKQTAFSSVKAGKKKVVLRWEKIKAVTGYQIQYSTKSNFKTNRTTIRVKGAASVSKTVKGLKQNKRYYVRIRTYKKINGKTYYSKWSKAKTFKTK